MVHEHPTVTLVWQMRLEKMECSKQLPSPGRQNLWRRKQFRQSHDVKMVDNIFRPQPCNPSWWSLELGSWDHTQAVQCILEASWVIASEKVFWDLSKSSMTVVFGCSRQARLVWLLCVSLSSQPSQLWQLAMCTWAIIRSQDGYCTYTGFSSKINRHACCETVQLAFIQSIFNFNLGFTPIDPVDPLIHLNLLITNGWG